MRSVQPLPESTFEVSFNSTDLKFLVVELALWSAVVRITLVSFKRASEAPHSSHGMYRDRNIFAPSGHGATIAMAKKMPLSVRKTLASAILL